MIKKSVLYLLSTMIIAMLNIGFVSCNDDEKEDSEKVTTYIITAELVSSSGCPEDFISYVRNLCNSVHTSIKGDSRHVDMEFSRCTTNMMRALFDKYSVSYYKYDYTIAFLAKDTSGDIKYKHTMDVRNGDIKTYDTKY